jgi:predicted secreted protein
MDDVHGSDDDAGVLVGAIVAAPPAPRTKRRRTRVPIASAVVGAFAVYLIMAHPLALAVLWNRAYDAPGMDIYTSPYQLRVCVGSCAV